MSDAFSSTTGGPLVSDQPASTNYFRESIKKRRPRATDSEIDAAVMACWEQLPRAEVAAKLKDCVLMRLDGDIE